MYRRLIGRFKANGTEAQKHTIARLIHDTGWTSNSTIFFTIYHKRYNFGGVYLRYMLRGDYAGSPALKLVDAHGITGSSGLWSAKLEISAATPLTGDWRYFDIDLSLDDWVETDVYIESNGGDLFVVPAFTVTEARRLEVWDTQGQTNFNYVALPDFTAVTEVQKFVDHNFQANLKVGGETVWHAGNDGAGSGLDADTVRGFAPSQNIVANGIVVRDAAGYISAQHFKATVAENSYTGHDIIITANADGLMYRNTVPGVLGMLSLGNVDNTSDANKPISTATQAALNGKLDKNRVYVAANHQAALDQDVAVDTSAGAFTVTAPAAPTENDYFYVGDGASNAAANTITVAFGAETYEGVAQNFNIDVDGFGTGFRYLGGTWRRYR